MNKDRLIVALDVPGFKEAERLVKTLSPAVNVFKVGKELFTSAGPDVVKMIHKKKKKVFLDLKFHDIPNTVGAACEAATKLGVFMLNVHASGGRAMLYAAAQSIAKGAAGKKTKPPILLGVTVLTSMTESDLHEIGVKKKVEDQVRELAKLAQNCGLDGVVASGQEIELIRKATSPSFVIVTPGVRPLWAAAGDQKRVVTPAEAIQKGAHFIVVGRPITQSADPCQAARDVLKEIEPKK